MSNNSHISLMTLHDILMSMIWNISQKHNFQEYKTLVEKQTRKLIKILGKCNKVNILHLNSRPRVKLMVYISSIYHTLHIKQKKVLERENTLLLKWFKIWYMFHYLQLFGLRTLSHVTYRNRFIFQQIQKYPMNCGHNINPKLFISMNSWLYMLRPHSCQKNNKMIFLNNKKCFHRIWKTRKSKKNKLYDVVFIMLLIFSFNEMSSLMKTLYLK
jgi:hypothetical protein